MDFISTSINGHVKLRCFDNYQNMINCVEGYNAVHFGNTTATMAQAWAGSNDGHIKEVAFGNGGTIVTPQSTVLYRSPNVSPLLDTVAALYNQTYSKQLTNLNSSVTDQDNIVDVNLSNSNFADIFITITLDFGEPSGQPVDGNTTDMEGTFVFDELALKSRDGLLLTHFIFHPIEKSLIRAMEIEYTLRIQLGENQ